MIEFVSVSKKYGAVTAVDGVSCSVEPGEFFALLGPNGAGKTTLVRVLMGFTRPTGGRVLVRGVPSSRWEARRNVGYLAENCRVPQHLTGRQYLVRCAELLGMDRGRIRSSVSALVEKVGMAGQERRPSRTYSKGMTQRIGLAAALLGSPKVLVLDEPTSGLDPIGIRDVRNLLEEQRAAGVTVFLNSHFLSEAERICDTAAIINRGRLVAKDSIGKIVGEGETLEDVFVRFVEGTTRG